MNDNPFKPYIYLISYDLTNINWGFRVQGLIKPRMRTGLGEGGEGDEEDQGEGEEAATPGRG